jgi:hypothetical protein
MGLALSGHEQILYCCIICSIKKEFFLDNDVLKRSKLPSVIFQSPQFNMTPPASISVPDYHLRPI